MGGGGGVWLNNLQNSRDPGLTPHNTSSNLSPHFLPISLKGFWYKMN